MATHSTILAWKIPWTEEPGRLQSMVWQSWTRGGREVDDIPDYEIMQISGLKCCPADAAEEIKAIADYVSVKKGGDGAARDVIEQTLKAQGRWFEKDACIW